MFGATKKAIAVTGTKRTLSSEVSLTKHESAKPKQTVKGTKRGLQNKTLAMIDIPFKSKKPIVVAFHDRNEPRKQLDSHPLTKTPLSNSTEMSGVKREHEPVQAKRLDQTDEFVEDFDSNSKSSYRDRVFVKRNTTSPTVKSLGDASNPLSSFHKLRLSILKRNTTKPNIDKPLIKNETVQEPKHLANKSKIYDLVDDYSHEEREDNGNTVNTFDEDTEEEASKAASKKNETNTSTSNDQQDSERNSTLSEEQENKAPESTTKKDDTEQNSASLKNETSKTPEEEASNKSEMKSEELLQKLNSAVEKPEQGDPNGIVEKVKDSWNSMAEAAVKLIKGQKDDTTKSEKEKLQQSLKLSSKLQEDLLQKDTTGEDLYDKEPNVNDLLAPKVPQTLPNDLLHGDWFDTAREPNQKTENDIKMSSDVLSKIAKAKMKGKQSVLQVPVGPESKKQYENRVKSITNLAESTENNMLSMLIQGSLGAAMKRPLDPLKLKNAEIEVGVKNPSEKTDNDQLQNVLSKYSDDFDIFVDKAALNQATTTDGQPMGEPVSSIKTLDALPDNESKSSADVTGSKKNRLKHYKKPSAKQKRKRVGKNDNDDDDVLMKRLSDKWKLFKEANKAVLEDTKAETQQKSHGKSKVSVKKKKKNSSNDVLNQYFDIVEGKQALDQINDLEVKQDKRKEKLRSTLHMIGDIEKEIDDIFTKEPLQDPPTGHIYLPSAQHHHEHNSRNFEHKKKGKAEIFKELSGISTNAMEKAQPKGTAQKEYMYLKDASTAAGFVNGQDKMFMTDYQPKSQSIMGIQGSESFANEQDSEQQPQNFIAPAQDDTLPEQKGNYLSKK